MRATSVAVAGILALGCTALSPHAAHGQQPYPNKPIRIVTGEAGGNGDFSARILAQGLTGSLNQSVVVQNLAGPISSAQTIARATPDGYSLLVAGSALWIGALFQKMPYDPVADYAPITATTNAPNVVVVHPSLPARSIKELIALAKAKPGELNYAAGALGAAAHLAGELFKAMTGVNIVAIPYKSAGPALNDVLGGRVPIMFGSAAAVSLHVKSGRLAALAVTSSSASPLFPGLPTVASTVPGYQSGSVQGVFAPAGTPQPLVMRLNQEITRVLNQADVREKYLSSGIETAAGSPEQLGTTVKSEMARLGKLIKDAGIKLE